jgi:hypothetical protein
VKLRTPYKDTWTIVLSARDAGGKAMKRALSLLVFAALVRVTGFAGEETVVSLRDFSKTELKYAGLVIAQPVTIHIRALGGGGDYGWTNKNDNMFAYGWILDAATRRPVWTMTADNTSKAGDDRQFDGTVSLQPGSYEVYFTAFAFALHSTFSHISTNVDHRNDPLFGDSRREKRNFFSWFKDFWSDDVTKEFLKRSPRWGMDLMVDASTAGAFAPFAPPRDIPNTVARAIGLGDNQCIRIAFEMLEPGSLHLYMLGERGNDADLADYGWIVNLADRKRVWDMAARPVDWAGGARKNIAFSGDVSLPKGQYQLYYITDGTHSMADWNLAPPSDPLDYGVTIAVNDPSDRRKFRQIQYNDYDNVIVSIVHPENSQHYAQGFTLKEDADVRVLCFGERSNARRLMADYGQILDARTRGKVWTMDVDRTYHGGGASKNRYIDEVIRLPRGSYEVTYTTDDSHTFDDWNSEPPFDPDHYGITVMGAGSRYSSAVVGKYIEERDKSIIAQIVRPGNDEDRAEAFHVDRATRVRIYGIGEGQGREMFDYGWIEDAKSGNIVWEMTYPMTFFAGGGRKNRMVNTTIMLDRGDYKLRWRSDDSHSYDDWNVDPPEDAEFWGITLFRDEGGALVPPPAPRAGEDDEDAPSIPPPPHPPKPPKQRSGR